MPDLPLDDNYRLVDDTTQVIWLAINKTRAYNQSTTPSLGVFSIVGQSGSGRVRPTLMPVWLEFCVSWVWVNL